MNDRLSEADKKAVCGILFEYLECTPEQLTDHASFSEDFSTDSLTKMEIALAVEQHFHITIPDDQFERISTVGNLFESIATLLDQPKRT
jgi:acyl carrier protein